MSNSLILLTILVLGLAKSSRKTAKMRSKPKYQKSVKIPAQRFRNVGFGMLYRVGAPYTAQGRS
jgi:hypothetical protein